MHFHKPQEKPSRWGSFADVQYAIRVNSEKIYDCDPDDDVLVMPLFWGLPCLDYSGYNNHGTNHGATYKDGSLEFDGVDDYVDTPFREDDGMFTLSYWVYFKDMSAEVVQRLGHHDAANHRLYLGISGNNLAWGYGDNYNLNGNLHGMDVDTWRLMTMVGTGSSWKIYVDKIIKQSGSDSWASGGSSVNFYIGKLNGQGLSLMDAKIDEVRISKATRSADQIALFHDNKYGLYQPVSRPFYSIPAVGITYITKTDSVISLQELLSKKQYQIQQDNIINLYDDYTAQFAGIIRKVLQDSINLFDLLNKKEEKKIIESLEVIFDTIIKKEEKINIDNLSIIEDTSTKQILKLIGEEFNLYDKYKKDLLKINYDDINIISDTKYLLNIKTIDDVLNSLTDTIIKTLEKIEADDFIVSDDYQADIEGAIRIVEKLLQDSILLDDVFNKGLTKTQFEELGISDGFSKSIIRIIRPLLYLFSEIKDYSGKESEIKDFLGISTDIKGH